jgi:hypothetical protein
MIDTYSFSPFHDQRNSARCQNTSAWGVIIRADVNPKAVEVASDIRGPSSVDNLYIRERR